MKLNLLFIAALAVCTTSLHASDQEKKKEAADTMVKKLIVCQLTSKDAGGEFGHGPTYHFELNVPKKSTIKDLEALVKEEITRLSKLKCHCVNGYWSDKADPKVLATIAAANFDITNYDGAKYAQNTTLDSSAEDGLSEYAVYATKNPCQDW